MRIIKLARVRELAALYADARPSLEHWLDAARRAHWHGLVHVRTAFRSADEVRVASGRAVVVFNIAGNRYRLVTAIHYNLEKLFVLLFLTHAEYSKQRWKETL